MKQNLNFTIQVVLSKHFVDFNTDYEKHLFFLFSPPNLSFEGPINH